MSERPNILHTFNKSRWLRIFFFELIYIILTRCSTLLPHTIFFFYQFSFWWLILFLLKITSFPPPHTNVKTMVLRNMFWNIYITKVFGLVNLYYVVVVVGLFFCYLIKMKHIFQDKIKIINILWLPTKKKKNHRKNKSKKWKISSTIRNKKTNTKYVLLVGFFFIYICWVELSIESQLLFFGHLET